MMSVLCSLPATGCKLQRGLIVLVQPANCSMIMVTPLSTCHMPNSHNHSGMAIPPASRVVFTAIAGCGTAISIATWAAGATAATQAARQQHELSQLEPAVQPHYNKSGQQPAGKLGPELTHWVLHVCDCRSPAGLPPLALSMTAPPHGPC